MGEWLYTFVYMHASVRCTALSPSALFPLRQALSQNLEMFFSQPDSQLVPEILLPPLPDPTSSARVTGTHGHAWLLHGCWESVESALRHQAISLAWNKSI